MTPTAEDFELVALRNGGFSLRARENRQTFHPGIGPVAEAMAVHIVPQRFETQDQTGGDPLQIWDVGLGAGANALTCVRALSALPDPGDVVITSFDTTTAALEFALDHAEPLGYPLGQESAIKSLLNKGQAVFPHRGSANIEWNLVSGDFPAWLRNAPACPPPTAVFYDPYSATVNPDMWTLEHFRNLRARLADDTPCLLTTYTRSTAIRTTLLLAGFFIGFGGATGEKEETTQASNRLDHLATPLRRKWLDKVYCSSNSAPLRTAGQESGPIRPDDLNQVHNHPQFHHE